MRDLTEILKQALSEFEAREGRKFSRELDAISINSTEADWEITLVPGDPLWAIQPMRLAFNPNQDVPIEILSGFEGASPTPVALKIPPVVANSVPKRRIKI